MKIGLIAYGLDRPLTGIGRYSVELAKALSNLEDGPQVTLMEAGHADALEGHPFLKTTLPGCRLLPGLMTLGNFLIPRRARSLNLDIVHDPNGLAPFLFGAGRSGTVLTLHDVLPLSVPGSGRALEKIIYRIWLPHAVRKAQAVIAPSSQSQADILRYLPVEPERVSVIPNGVSSFFHPLPEPDVRRHLIRRFGLEDPFILTVGSAAPRKNIGRVVEAFAILAKDFPRLRLVLAGSRPMDRSAARTIPAFAADRILKVGPVSDSDLVALYAGCGLFVFPSLYEGFGLPPLEAMACAAPVVCSDRSSLPEVVGDVARLVDPTDIGGMADAMHEILSDKKLRRKMRERGPAWAQKFSWERNARSTMEVYRKVVYHTGDHLSSPLEER